ncbi:MAG: DivIVA domain-containing protein [Candidatus Zhuqueibacterota bacterium]
MKITPLDIKKQVFKKVFRGYDPIEVETFLEMVAEEFEYLNKLKNELSDDVLRLKTQLRDYQEVEKTFKESLMNAQQTINQSRENSKRESDLVIKEAEVKAEKMLETTKRQLIDLKNQLMVVKAQKDSFAKRLRHLLESQVELLSVLEMDDIGYEPQHDARNTGQINSRVLNQTSSAMNFSAEKKNNDIKKKLSDSDLKISDQFII